MEDLENAVRLGLTVDDLHSTNEDALMLFSKILDALEEAQALVVSGAAPVGYVLIEVSPNNKQGVARSPRTCPSGPPEGHLS